jgi:hypothetical protein
MMLQCPTFFYLRSLFLILPLLLLCFSTPSSVSGQEFAIQSDSLIRFFERDTTKGNDRTVLPIYEYLRLDYYNDPARKLSFHAYGWGRADLTDSDYYNNATDGELIYGYLEYKSTLQKSVFRLGRQPIYTGVATDYIDGLRYTSNIGSLFSVSLHGGQPVGYSDESGRSGDLSLGGRLGHHYGTRYDVGLSYQLTRNDSLTVEEFLAIDLNLALPADISIDTFTSLNLTTNSLAEQYYAVRLNLLETDLKLFFETFSYDDYFPSATVAPQPFSSLATSGETLTRYGINATLPINSTWETGAKLTSYSYDIKNESALFGAVLLTWRGEGLQQIGGEIGYLDAKVIDDDLLRLRFFVYWDQLPTSVSSPETSSTVLTGGVFSAHPPHYSPHSAAVNNSSTIDWR